MGKKVDARGLSCPQPVLLTLDVLKTTENEEILILVDTDTSKENVIRAAASKGWRAKEVQPDGIDYRIMLAKD